MGNVTGASDTFVSSGLSLAGHPGTLPGQRLSLVERPTPSVVEQSEPRPSQLSLPSLVRAVAILDSLTILAAMALAWPLRDLMPYLPPATPHGVLLALKV